ncbi:hypothetical protein B0A54_04706 [Friedmanniomyces endolithicus]|uniref:tripeptidyl-peptidase II n=1 Tax=Friedmanniomyces endolithicus TaxID=329885 RepID=A0A4U0V9Z3_9PEZI|nr:hypothetical protein LTS09_008565 [Friedmanniomyces endolithicus]TKA44755.1 hypothetical protein B0A54_04706 [Friedmanniomyces endolithicus]
MHLFRSVAVSALVAVAVASPLGVPHSVHEKRSEAATGWARRDVLDRRAILPMKIGLAQSNVDQGWNWLKEVSVPTSSKYGQHWSAKDIAEAFAPSNETVDAAKNWLTMAGISESRIKQSQGLNWLEFDATVDEAEELLKTKYHVYEHEATGQPHVACDEYSIPTHLKEHIDLVYPTVHFDAKIKSRDDGVELEKRDGNFGHGRGPRGPGGGPWGGPGGGWRMPYHHRPTNDLANCDVHITPDCLRALYRFPVNYRANPKNSFGIVEYTPEAYVPSDLDLFFANFSQRSIGERPIFDSIDGGVNQQTNMSFNFNGESDLDLEYPMTLVYPQPVTLYQVGDLVEGASFNNFLDAIDASYCSYDGGDDPTQDAKYPDPYGGYQGPENCGGFAATKVISTSYAYNEADLTPFYEQRQCHEYMKLGMMGVSVLYSSGDYGVAGNGGQCITSPVGAVNATYNNGTSGRFNPSFPGTCPYITSVGATQVKNNTNIVTALATGTQPEEACETVIYSGGGFSNVFPLPEYQANAVHHWFADYPPPYGPDRFNNSQQTRGLPDMSANGANYVIAIDGNFSLVYGTSASTPATGSILTLINQARLDKGKSSIGFINPVIYAHPEILNDITEGGNQGCGTPGFESAPGWDPVTGLGTPNYPKMLKLWVDELN